MWNQWNFTTELEFYFAILGNMKLLFTQMFDLIHIGMKFDVPLIDWFSFCWMGISKLACTELWLLFTRNSRPLLVHKMAFPLSSEFPLGVQLGMLLSMNCGWSWICLVSVLSRQGFLESISLHVVVCLAFILSTKKAFSRKILWFPLPKGKEDGEQNSGSCMGTGPEEGPKGVHALRGRHLEHRRTFFSGIFWVGLLWQTVSMKREGQPHTRTHQESLLFLH